MNRLGFVRQTYERGIELDFSRLGKPGNAKVESFSGRLRQESLTDAQDKIEVWRRHYNDEARPHSALVWRTHHQN